jgi:hypothetical protein
MSSKRITLKANEFTAEILKNFCYVNKQLKFVFSQYQKTSKVSFSELADLLGTEMNQGRLWRLKDKAHLLFRMHPEPTLAEKYLDWSISYIFHECMKLKEDAYQLQTYVPWFHEVRRNKSLTSLQRQKAENFFQLTTQTRESIEREIKRILFIMENYIDIFVDYLSLYSNNSLLARFIYDHQELVQEVFQSKYENLISAMYNYQPEQLYFLAAISFKQGGWHFKAQKAIDQALKISPDNAKLKLEKKIIDNLLKKR